MKKQFALNKMDPKSKKKSGKVKKSGGALGASEAPKPGEIVLVRSGPHLFRAKPPKQQKESTKKGKSSKTKLGEDDEDIGDEEEIETVRVPVGEGDEGDSDDDFDYDDGGDETPSAKRRVTPEELEETEAESFIVDGKKIAVERGLVADFKDVPNPLFQIGRWGFQGRMAQTFDAPRKLEEVVTHEVAEAIYETGVIYQEEYLMKVGERGLLEPIKGKLYRVGEEELVITPRDVPRDPMEKSIIPNAFDERYPIGERVVFYDLPTKSIVRADITKADEDGIFVFGRAVPKEGDPSAKIPEHRDYYVKYDTKSLKLAPRFGSYVEITVDKQTYQGIVVSTYLHSLRVFIPTQGVKAEKVVYHTTREAVGQEATGKGKKSKSATTKKESIRLRDYESSFFIVSYDSVRIIPRPPKGVSRLRVGTSDEDLFSNPVPERLRKVIIDTYVRTLEEIVVAPSTTSGSTASAIKDQIYSMQPIPWDQYYQYNLKLWYWNLPVEKALRKEQRQERRELKATTEELLERIEKARSTQSDPTEAIEFLEAQISDLEEYRNQSFEEVRSREKHLKSTIAARKKQNASSAEEAAELALLKSSSQYTSLAEIDSLIKHKRNLVALLKTKTAKRAKTPLSKKEIERRTMIAKDLRAALEKLKVKIDAAAQDRRALEGEDDGTSSDAYQQANTLLEELLGERDELESLLRENETMLYRDKEEFWETADRDYQYLKKEILEAERKLGALERTTAQQRIGQELLDKHIGPDALQTIREAAVKEAENQSDRMEYVNLIVDVLNDYERLFELPDGSLLKRKVGLTYETTAEDLRDAFKQYITRKAESKQPVHVFDAHVAKKAERAISMASGRVIKGREFAMLVRDCVVSHFQIYPPNPETIYNAMYEQIASKVFKELQVPDKKRKQFDTEVLPALKKTYDDALESYDREVKALAEKKKARDAVLVAAEKLGRRASTIKKEIEAFEAVVYAQFGAAPGGTVYNYLFNALFPYIFLSGPVAPYAKVFRAKLANGDYNFAKLAQANLGHFAPELVMEIGFGKDNKSKENMALVNQTLVALLDGAVTETVKLYYSILNPTLHRPLETSFWEFVMKNDKYEAFLKLFGNPQEICERETKSGYKQVSKMIGGELVTTREKITDGDLVICYRKGKFTCHDSTEVAKQISSGNTTNPYTGKPFPESFVDKMKKRYFEEKEAGLLVIKPKTVVFTQGTKTGPVKPAGVEIPKKDTRPKDSIVVMGPAEKALSVFGDEIDLGSGETLYFTNYVAHTDRVVVLSFDLEGVKDDDETKKVIKALKKDYPSGKKFHVAVIGLNAEGKSVAELKEMKKKIQKKLSRRVDVYFTKSASAADVTEAIEDVWKEVTGK